MAMRAFITGVTGQDGSHLADLLLAKGYEVHALVRRSASSPHERIRHLRGRMHEHEGDLLDGGSLMRIVRQVRPHEVYNLAAQSHVHASFQEPEHTGEVTGLGAVRLLEAVRLSGHDARFYQASSSELFGSAPPPQSETTPFHPRSPYAVAKAYAHHATVNYREAYGLHASCGILFNHEGPRRGEAFVTRKITMGAARIKAGLQEKLFLGNLDAKRDWGFAGDYVEAMWLMLQQPTPDDYVIATGETHSIREFLDEVFGQLGLDWQKHVEVDPRFYRPAEVDALRGDADKARKVLGWKPKVDFRALAKLMVEADVAHVNGGSR